MIHPVTPSPEALAWLAAYDAETDIIEREMRGEEISESEHAATDELWRDAGEPYGFPERR